MDSDDLAAYDTSSQGGTASGAAMSGGGRAALAAQMAALEQMVSDYGDVGAYTEHEATQEIGRDNREGVADIGAYSQSTRGILREGDVMMDDRLDGVNGADIVFTDADALRSGVAQAGDAPESYSRFRLPAKGTTALHANMAGAGGGVAMGGRKPILGGRTDGGEARDAGGQTSDSAGGGLRKQRPLSATGSNKGGLTGKPHLQKRAPGGMLAKK